MSEKEVKSVLKKIEEQHGLSIQQLGGQVWAPVERISSGSYCLDAALGGGWPRGRCIEVWGVPSGWKTLLSLMAVTEVQKKDCN